LLTRARVLTMCLSPNCLMPESQVYAQIRNIQLPAMQKVTYWSKQLKYCASQCCTEINHEGFGSCNTLI
jgi:hypothetical protein